MAKRIKTEKYFLECYLGDALLSTRVELTKKEYADQLEALEKQYLATSDKTLDFYTEKDMFFNESEMTTQATVVYSYGVNDIRLMKVTCKSGYCFS